MPIDYTTGDMTYSGVTQDSQLGHTPLDPSSSRAQLGTVVSQEAVQYSGIVPDDPRNHEQAYTWPTEGVSIQLRGIEVSTHENKNQYNHLLEIFLVDGDKVYDVGGDNDKRSLISDITSGNQLRGFCTNRFNRENYMVHRELERAGDPTAGGIRNFLGGPTLADYNENFLRPLYLSDDPNNDIPRRRGSRTVAGVYDDQSENPEYPQAESGFIVNIPFPDMHIRIAQGALQNTKTYDSAEQSEANDVHGVNCGFNPREVFGETTEEFSNDIKGPGQYLFIIRMGGDDPTTGANRWRRNRSYYRCAFPKRLFHALITHPEYAGGMARLMYGNWVPDQTHDTEKWWNYRTAVPGIYPVDATTPTGYAVDPINPVSYDSGVGWVVDNDYQTNYAPRWTTPSTLASANAPYGDYYNDTYGWAGITAPHAFFRQQTTGGSGGNFTGDPVGVIFPHSEFEQQYFLTDGPWQDTFGGTTYGSTDVHAWELSTFEIAVTGPNDRAFRPWDGYPKNPEIDEDPQEYSYVPMITPIQGIHSGQPIHQSFQQNLNPQKTVDYLTGIGTSRSQETVDVEAIALMGPQEGPTGNDLPIYAGPVNTLAGNYLFTGPTRTGPDGRLGIFSQVADQDGIQPVSDAGRNSALHYCLDKGYTGWDENASQDQGSHDGYYKYSTSWQTENIGYSDYDHVWNSITCTADSVEVIDSDSVGTLNAGVYCADTYGYNISHTPDMATSVRTILPYTGDVASNVIIGDSIDPSPTRHVVTDDDNFPSFISAADFPNPIFMYATNPIIEDNNGTNDFNDNTLLADQDGVNTANQFCIDLGYIGADVNAAGSIIVSVAGEFDGGRPAYSYAVYYIDNQFNSDGWFNYFESDLGTTPPNHQELYNIAIWAGIECIESATSPATQVSVWDGQSWEAPVWNASAYYDSVTVWNTIVCEPHTETDDGAEQPIRGPEDIQDFTPTIEVYTGAEISLQRYWDSTVEPTEFQAATALNDISVRVNLDDLDASLEYTGLTYKFRVISWGDEENLSGLTDPEIDLQLYDGYDEISIREYPYEDVYWNDPNYVPPQTWVGQVWSGPGDPNEPIRGILSHAYREGGLKTIRGYVISTMVDQRNPDYVQALRWKYFITKIYVSPPVYEVQDFGVLGGYDFTTIPFTDTRDAVAPIPTPIIGGLSDNSQYKKSINALLKSGEFADQDQDEIVALEAAQSTDEMGQHIGKTDFQQMRLFGDGTYDLDRLIGPDGEESIILTEKINNAQDRVLKDKCLVELNPGELSAGSILDTSGRGNLGIMIGDYGLEKASTADPLTKTSNMLTPEIGTQDKAL